jgi:hypothetical protein
MKRFSIAFVGLATLNHQVDISAESDARWMLCICSSSSSICEEEQWLPEASNLRHVYIYSLADFLTTPPHTLTAHGSAACKLATARPCSLIRSLLIPHPSLATSAIPALDEPSFCKSSSWCRRAANPEWPRKLHRCVFDLQTLFILCHCATILLNYFV